MTHRSTCVVLTGLSVLALGLSRLSAEEPAGVHKGGVAALFSVARKAGFVIAFGVNRRRGQTQNSRRKINKGMWSHYDVKRRPEP